MMQSFKQQQSVLVSAFSKTLARNLTMSINDFEDEMTHKMSKKLLNRAEFGQNISLKQVGAGEEALEDRGISKAV